MSKIFDEIEVSQGVKNFVDHSFAISDQIFAILQKQGKSQRDLANLMGKKESEISKWLTGMHNFTLKSIAKIEATLGESLILTPEKAEQLEAKRIQFVPVRVTALSNAKRPLSEFDQTNNGVWKEGSGKIFRGGVKVA